MEWTLSQRGEKVGVLFFPVTVANIITIIVALWCKVDLLTLFIVLGLMSTLVEIFLYYTGTYLNAWNYPRIVKINEGKIRVFKYDLKKEVYVNMGKPIEFSSIYQIEIRDKFFRMYYERDGKKYFTGFALDGFFIRYIKGEREKRMQILNEVLKRVDKNRVVIIDKRKRENLKISGGDR